VIEVAPKLFRTVVGDIGGGTWRAGIGSIGPKGVEVNGYEKETLKFGSTKELLDFALARLKHFDLTGISTVVISNAGPVDKQKGTIIKITNQGGVEERNIPLVKEMSDALTKFAKRPIKVYLINDAEAGAWAEFGPGGGLNHLKPGQLGMVLIVGNGVGGYLMELAEDGSLIPVPGADEPGHRPVPASLVTKLKLWYLGSYCGCLLRGDMAEQRDPCLEVLTRGPALEKAFQMELNDPSVTNQQVVKMLYDNDQLTQGKILGVLMNEALLLARSLDQVQRGLELTKGKMHITPIGGVGCGFGNWLVPLLNAVSRQNANIARPAWGISPEYYVAGFDPDFTNLVGNTVLAARK
jgi:hypothetical protein